MIPGFAISLLWLKLSVLLGLFRIACAYGIYASARHQGWGTTSDEKMFNWRPKTWLWASLTFLSLIAPIYAMKRISLLRLISRLGVPEAVDRFVALGRIPGECLLALSERMRRSAERPPSPESIWGREEFWLFVIAWLLCLFGMPIGGVLLAVLLPPAAPAVPFLLLAAMGGFAFGLVIWAVFSICPKCSRWFIRRHLGSGVVGSSTDVKTVTHDVAVKDTHHNVIGYVESEKRVAVNTLTVRHNYECVCCGHVWHDLAKEVNERSI